MESPIQQGSGLGQILSGLVKQALPILKKKVLLAVVRLGKEVLSNVITKKKGVKQALLDAGRNRISEFVENMPVTGRSKKCKKSLPQTSGKRRKLNLILSINIAIHPQSCESAMSNLQLFTVPSTYISTEVSRYVEHKPVSTLDKGSNLYFKIKADESESLDFSQSLLHLKYTIVAKDRRALKRKVADDTVPDRSIVFPVNYLIGAMFKQVEVYLGGRLVSSNDTIYLY